jgi:glycosyltransferase involved in cell wall biosynthesis
MNHQVSPVLSVVMPVYNEAELIGDVVREWSTELQRLDTDYEFLIYDDGSRDKTPEVLQSLAAELPGLIIHRHANRGHGPTILRGYREARGDWVFQTDSDGEMDVEGLSEMWRGREDYDFILGSRAGRVSTPVRWLVTGVSRLSVGILFGWGIHDVNAPFRLMRRDWLQDAVEQLPDDLFAPNVVLSGLAVRSGLRVREIDVRFEVRRRHAGSLGSLKVFRPAARSLYQTIAVARRESRSPRR